MTAKHAWAAALAALAMLLPATTAAQLRHGAPMARTEIALTPPGVALVDQEGRRFAFADARGRPVLIAFIYTSCHHVCPLIFDSVRAAQEQTRAQLRRDVGAVFVTVDPEIDTPAALKAYAVRRGADPAGSVFLTGQPQDLEPVWKAFGVSVKRLGRGLVDHPPMVFLADAQGTVRARYAGSLIDGETVVADVRRLPQDAAPR